MDEDCDSLADEIGDDTSEYDDDDWNGEDDWQDLDERMDGDFDSAMTSAGFGTDEDYGYYGDCD